MINSFSENLIRETIHIFKEEDALELTPEMAMEYLQQLAGLYLAFAERGGAQAPEGAETTPLT